MTSKEWIKNELSYTDDHLTTSDRIMLNKILKDLERLEALEKAYKKVVESIVHYEYTKQRLENEKLKKAIEILKKYIDFNFDLCGKGEIMLLEQNECPIDLTTIKFQSQQEYDLLKEVLGE